MYTVTVYHKCILLYVQMSDDNKCILLFIINVQFIINLYYTVYNKCVLNLYCTVYNKEEHFAFNEAEQTGNWSQPVPIWKHWPNYGLHITPHWITCCQMWVHKVCRWNGIQHFLYGIKIMPLHACRLLRSTVCGK